jgi:hypothetical protein
MNISELMKEQSWYTKSVARGGNSFFTIIGRKDTPTTNVFLTDEGEKPTIRMARLLRDIQTGNAIGVLGVDLDYKVIEQIVAKLDTKFHGALLLADEDGNAIYKKDPDHWLDVGEPWSQVDQSQREAGVDQFTRKTNAANLSGLTLKRQGGENRASCGHGIYGTAHLRLGSDYGERRVVSYPHTDYRHCIPAIHDPGNDRGLSQRLKRRNKTMGKIAFLGAGSTVFAKNVLGDCMLTPSIDGFEFALFDIDSHRLRDSENMLNNLKEGSRSDVKIKAYTDRKEALRGAKYVINAIQVGGYEPCTVTDFEIPKKYGLQQTIADTVGIGGIFRSLRTIPVMLDFARDIQEVCSDAWFFNYTNPMAVLTATMIRHGGVKTVGLCHSVQVCASRLLQSLDMPTDDLQWKIAGINHMAWLLEISRKGENLYPEIKREQRKSKKQNTLIWCGLN